MGGKDGGDKEANDRNTRFIAERRIKKGKREKDSRLSKLQSWEDKLGGAGGGKGSELSA